MDELRKNRQQMAEAGQIDISRLDRDEKQYLYNRITEKKRRLALSNFFYFCKYVLGYLDMAEMHEELCSFVVRKNKWGRYSPRKLVLEPRGTFKSSIVTISYPLWRVVQNPNLRVLIDSEDFSKSKAFSRAIKDHVVGNAEFRRLFGALDAKKNSTTWTQAEWNVSTRTSATKETTFSCAGVDITKVSMHYDLIICDDLVSDRNVTTLAQMEKVIQHYKLLLSLLEPDGELIFIGTRWDDGDLYGHLIETDERRERRGRRPVFRKLIRAAYDEEGTLLFPERLTKAFLDAQKRAQGSAIFSAQYLNDPVGGGEAPFKKEWIKYFDELPQTNFSGSIIVDPALGKNTSKSKKRDQTAMAVVLVDPFKNWYVVKVERGNWNPTALIRRLASLRKWVVETFDIQPRVAIEGFAFQQVLEYYAKDLMQRNILERFPFYQLESDTSVSKEARIQGIIPLMEDGKIFLSRDKTEGLRVLVHEMLRFPRGRTDDCLDALAWTAHVAVTPQQLKTREKLTFWGKLIMDRNLRGTHPRTRPVGSRVVRA
jgi:hypothetical protein